jgi:8-oxo-dGTP pyrophosphatase MutT (NUDIX family)
MTVTRRRGAVVLIESGRVAVIERHLGTDTWYLLPGGGAEDGETVEEAAIREAREELGIDVRLGGVVARVLFDRGNGTSSQVYFRATRVGGTFGTGDGREYSLPRDHPSGTYRPTWLELPTTAHLDVRPRSLFAALRERGPELLECTPVEVRD